MWEKEKLLVASNFSFSHCVFKRPVHQACEKPRFVWERVNQTSQSTEKRISRTVTKRHNRICHELPVEVRFY